MKTVFDVLIEKLGEQKLSFVQYLVDGGVKDFAGYKETCGVLRGLASAQRTIADLAKIQEDNDD